MHKTIKTEDDSKVLFVYFIHIRNNFRRNANDLILLITKRVSAFSTIQ